jgi:hypothetical protein
MPIQINDSLAVSSVAGSLFFMLKNKNIPWYEKIIYFATGSTAAYFTGTFFGNYTQWDYGVCGIISFLAAVFVIPVMETLLDFIKNPQKVVSLYKQVKGDK